MTENLLKWYLYNYGDNSEFKRKDIILNDNATSYIISFLSDVSKYDQYLPIAQKMIQSFDIIRDSGSDTTYEVVAHLVLHPIIIHPMGLEKILYLRFLHL